MSKAIDFVRRQINRAFSVAADFKAIDFLRRAANRAFSATAGFVAKWIGKKNATRRRRLRSNVARRLKSITQPAIYLWREARPVRAALYVLLASSILLGVVGIFIVSFGTFWKELYVQAWGTVLDILVVGLILGLFAIGRERRESIARYLEEIDDLKKWDSEEARLRIAGNVRRLARLRKTDIDFSGIVLRNFSFLRHDIESLKGSTFSRGLHFTMSKNDTELENVDFSHVNCSGVVFSKATGPFPGMGLVGKNLTFVDSELIGTTFDGAVLSWTDYEANEEKWFEDVGCDEEGVPFPPYQKHYPAFSGADLTGCSFRFVQFDHADFRDAQNVLQANFEGARGLETCFFDEDVRAQVIASTK